MEVGMEKIQSSSSSSTNLDSTACLYLIPMETEGEMRVG